MEAHFALPMSLTQAQSALDGVLADHVFGTHSSDAYAEGLALLLRVGPRGATTGLSKEVLVHVLEPRTQGSTVVVPLRWEATGASGRLFPTLDANVGLTTASPGSTLLSIVGRYEPPLGALGERLDHAILARVADATARALVQRLGRLIVDAANHDGAPARAS